jgi:hypothetical protein
MALEDATPWLSLGDAALFCEGLQREKKIKGSPV